MSFNNVGLVWVPETLETYLASIQPPTWIKAICLHHTASPSLQQRPKGLTIQHIKNIRDFYIEKGWKSGPHFFADDDEILGMTPVTETGVHAVSFNRMALGIEVLGYYDSEPHNSGRGLACWQTTAMATKILLKWLNLEPNHKTVLFHREDPKTSKTCPGTLVSKTWVLDLINKSDTRSHEQARTCVHEPVMQMTSVSEYLKTVKGYTDADIKTLLHKTDDGLFLFGNDWLENAYYDKATNTTIAPFKELVEINIRNKNKDLKKI